jgi:putative membrane protein
MQLQNLAVVVVVAIIVVFAVLLVGGIGMAGAGMMGVGMMGGMGLGLPLMGGLFMLGVPVLFVGGLVWLIVALTRGSSTPVLPTTTQQTPLDILKARYARGEISKEQFDEMRQHLAA